ncbi:MAG: squalene synthase HpnC [Phycisphaeraceae bacterium]|nr:MAG: squalene synthase HpnC [Phycisphaeraceae bacterium]
MKGVPTPVPTTRPPTPESHATIGRLDRYGPDADPGAAPPSEAEALDHVRRLATGHYENFSVLSRLVPEDLRDDFAAVYAYCRWSDDLADETGAGDEARARSLELLRWWRGELDRCFAFAHSETDAESPRHPVFITLAATIRRRELPPEPFHHLLDAFEQDQRITRYQTWDELLAYCRGSADPVGRLVLALGGHRLDDPANAERIAMSDATCTALQLTNFWQDVRRDLFERDRVYMPFEETNLDADTLRDFAARPNDPEARIPFIRAMRPLTERTRELFIKGRPLPQSLDARLRPVVWLFGAGGESVLTSIERMGGATLWTRPRLPRSRKLLLVMRASLLRMRTSGGAS